MCYRGEITGTPVVGRGSGGQGAHLRICGPLRHAEQFIGLVLSHRSRCKHKRAMRMHDGVFEFSTGGARAAWRCLLSAGRQTRTKSKYPVDFDSTPPTI